VTAPALVSRHGAEQELGRRARGALTCHSRFPSGAVFAIIGPTGAGKFSTM